MRCTGAGLASGFVCLQVNTPGPVIADVIRLSHGHLLPASRPAGHNLRMESTPITPHFCSRVRMHDNHSLRPIPDLTLTGSQIALARVADTTLYSLLARPATR
ncbi:hypothetical protein LF1_53810 [Rubripirellula obstinata]|uniref:Uncharacterized protein n=1 Tax=Rubripirellula obstinata TaxID=406547 RepID=A0A5B1CAD2_9BACT|nr:hypothetical protein LF1_53810 [Rubripirellula obstinata]